MPPVPIKIKPGVDVQSTPASEPGTAWAESHNIRFFQGLAQKMGGFDFFEDTALHGGRPVAMRAWATLAGINELAVAGENLVSLISAQSLADITPYTGYQTIPIVLGTTLGETEVTVFDQEHEPAVGDWIRFVAPIAVGGLILDGPYRITEIVTVDSYKIVAAAEAASTVIDGGSARVFATTAGSDTVTATLTRHGLTSGDIARIPATVTVGGLSLYGNYVAEVTSANVYTITAAAAAAGNDSVTENGNNIAMELYTRRASAAGGTIVAYADSGTAAYAPAGQLTVTGGTGTAPVFSIIYTEVVTVAINAVGAGGSPGAHTFRGTTGAVATNRFEFTAFVDGAGTLTGATPVLTLGGDYSVNPTSLTGEPILDITDGTLVGGTVNVGMWPLLIAYPPLVPGNLTAIPPDDPVNTTGGGGTGAQVTVDWSYGSSAQNPLRVENVSLDTWGEFLVIVPKQGPVFVWQPSQGTLAPAENVLTGPQANTIAFIAGQQRILVAGGSVSFASGLFDPMLVRWSEAGDYTDWTPTSANQAGSYRLQLGSEIVGGLPIAGQNLIFTDVALYAMQYVEPPFVWGFQPIGMNCGLVGPKALGVLNDVVAWMSAKQFYTRAGGRTPAVIPCSVWDQVFKNLDPAYLRQTHCTTNAYFGEIAWHVRQLDGSTTRAKLQVGSGAWDYTTIPAGSVEARSAGIDQNVFGAPFGASPAGRVYKEETGTDAFTSPLEARLLSGIAMLAEGDQAVFFSKIVPDVKFANDPGEGVGTLKVTVYLYRDPQAAPRVKGPYPINARTRTIPCRGRARGIQFEFASDDLGSAWRLGIPTYIGQADGRGG